MVATGEDHELSDELLWQAADGIGRITFNRPAQRNALTWAMYDGLVAAIERADRNESLRVVVITGAGGKAFAAGTDIGQFRGFDGPQDAIGYEQRIERVLSTLEACRHPTIAAIEGACTGGGAAIAACCDLRIAASGARFGFPIGKTLGNCLSMNNLARLSALIGAAKVKEMIFTARLLGAEEARAAGFVTEVVADDAEGGFAVRVEALAQSVAGMAPLTLRSTKMALLKLRPAIIEDEALILMAYESADFREGMEAFLAKRPPQWRGA